MVSLEALRIARPGDAKPFDLGHVLKGYGTNLQHLLEVYCQGCNPPLKPGKDDKAIKAAYYRIYRRLKKLAAEGLITCKKGADGLVIATPEPGLLYLMEQNSNYANKDGKDAQYTPGRRIAARNASSDPHPEQRQHLPPDARRDRRKLHYVRHRVGARARCSRRRICCPPYSNRTTRPENEADGSMQFLKAGSITPTRFSSPSRPTPGAFLLSGMQTGTFPRLLTDFSRFCISGSGSGSPISASTSSPRQPARTASRRDPACSTLIWCSSVAGG